MKISSLMLDERGSIADGMKACLTISVVRCGSVEGYAKDGNAKIYQTTQETSGEPEPAKSQVPGISSRIRITSGCRSTAHGVNTKLSCVFVETALKAVT
jgi:hypothetical protein